MRVRKSRKKLAAYERCSWLAEQQTFKKKRDYCSKRSATTKLNISLYAKVWFSFSEFGGENPQISLKFGANRANT